MMYNEFIEGLESKIKKNINYFSKIDSLLNYDLEKIFFMLISVYFYKFTIYCIKK